MQVRDAFAASALFSGYEPECRLESFSDGQSLSDYADGHDAVGLIVAGLADVWAPASDGTMTLLNTLRPGDCFGIAYLYDGREMQTEVMARGQCSAAFVDRRRLQELLETDARFAERYHALCNRKIQFLLDRIAVLTAQTCRTRLAAYLLLNRGEDGAVPLHGTKDDLASRLSVSRAAVYRELRELQNKGLIRLAQRQIMVLEPDGLEKCLYVGQENRSNGGNET